MKLRKTLSAIALLLSASGAYAQDYVGGLNIDTANLVWSSNNSYSSGQVVREGSSGDLYLAKVGINASDSNLSPSDDSRWVLLLKGDVHSGDTIKIPESGKVIFVTSQEYSGYDVYGRDKADEFCQTAADSSVNVPSGVYTAWNISNAASPIATSKAYYLLDGTQVVNQGSDLKLYSSILHPINLDESLSQVNASVWTEEDTGWTCYAGPGQSFPSFVGNSSSANVYWSAYGGSYQCTSKARLYCAQK
ncbi:hypothetical protein [Pseudoalteromonas luteoviolacea]|uniref:DUF1554 domain-containing protein n=1 Tax=Pseudoalteromonas luteoviolacea S4054 TaxID=1129367 RepID=A0A0F6A7U7_9GAMM|nr:hypothetical protein [Pseudoalteromonas luteoviolacea]AOT07767.1 hypothetical protein S4054249_07905 [Pseudoalteromonas luteoviolacea]AOT12683.1 hypothetical protein S40542_07905 [Pseudoalteromonas luteoviolacea]AOT17596.1 hypothetical protein S4054_07900 [Pseudoalteromonas luteoviolacea]KKE82250.1 hypothetical protein N479_18605 [Pseudoalteromonas luteoviolacea S4054]KZN78902.1 hypothetical protein N481_00235 [Pseudoalteromonas luteoviolacea S4047-1]